MGVRQSVLPPFDLPAVEPDPGKEFFPEGGVAELEAVSFLHQLDEGLDPLSSPADRSLQLGVSGAMPRRARPEEKARAAPTPWSGRGFASQGLIESPFPFWMRTVGVSSHRDPAGMGILSPACFVTESGPTRRGSTLLQRRSSPSADVRDVVD